jgi:hypothetical protein
MVIYCNTFYGKGQKLYKTLTIPFSHRETASSHENDKLKTPPKTGAFLYSPAAACAALMLTY